MTDLTPEKENDNVFFAQNSRSIFSGKEHTSHTRGRKNLALLQERKHICFFSSKSSCVGLCA